MPLTTAISEQIASNVVTDVNANLPAPAARPRQLSPEAALLMNKSLVARPLMVPEVCSIHVKNLEYRYRWVNRDGQNGRFYMQRKAQGFTNANSADVDILGGDVANQDGEIRAGDLILMKIQADLYDGHIKYNMLKAEAMTRARGMYLEGASSDVNSDTQAKRMSVINEPFSKSGMAQPFIPANPDAIVEDSIAKGRVETTRKTVDELRANAPHKE